MATDDSSLLPDAPPPRPVGRDAAIGTAMRRFDGVADAPEPQARPSRRFGFGQRPQVGALITASLIVVIGLPATLIAIRENSAPPAEMKMPPAVSREAPAPVVAPQPEAEVAELADAGIKLPPPAPSNLPAPDRRRPLSDEEAVAFSPPPPAAAIAPPAPPPPPPPPAPQQEAYAAERDAGDSQIVVTGSRIEAPRSLSPRPFEALNADTTDATAEAKATRGVLADPAYRRFLSQLQAAVRGNDRSRVVALAGLPLRVNVGGASRTYRDAQSVLADYDRIFTAKVRQAILAQRYESLFTRDKGLMIGSGEVWFDRVCRDRNCARGPVRILAINP